jgi:hypothetical protein
MPAAPVQGMTHDRWRQSYFCKKIEELLLDYGRSNPLVKMHTHALFFCLSDITISAVDWSSSLYS